MDNDTGKKDFYQGGNRAERRRMKHKNKSYAVIAAKRFRAKMKRKAKNASKKKNGNQG